ncbi:conjugal transfer protein [Nocardia carnea]|uniref:Conjugal transfer protein n=1 Tax=Nocardia carnea TaxID=37328 RepID=A0ABW7TJH3_9NOCA|nr:conjugal transfer protein [Nocardia carnea]
MRTGAAGRADSGEALLRQMAARRRRDNIVVVVLAVLAVLGGGHAVYSFFAPDPAPPGDEEMVGVTGHASLAASFAQDFVVTYLSADANDQDALSRYVDGTQRISLPKTGAQVNAPLVVYVARTLDAGAVEVWSVTVSVQMGRPGSGAARHYYRVPVSVSEGSLRALTLPAAVEPPAVGSDLAQAYSSPCGEETAFAQVATGFLNAYLTGAGDVARYVTVDSGISALRPGPFTELGTVTVTAEDSGCGTAGTSAQVLATVTPKGATGTAPALAYPLTMVRGEGQWQVRAIETLPALKEPLTLVVPPGENTGPATGSTTGAPTSTAEIPPATQN